MNLIQSSHVDIDGKTSAFFDDAEFVVDMMVWLEKAVVEVSNLMNDSFHRFKRTDLFANTVCGSDCSTTSV